METRKHTVRPIEVAAEPPSSLVEQYKALKAAELIKRKARKAAKRTIAELSIADHGRDIAEQGESKARRVEPVEVEVARLMIVELPVPRHQPAETLTTTTVISVLQEAAQATPIVINHEQRIDFSREPGVPVRISSLASIVRPVQQESEEAPAPAPSPATVEIKSNYTYSPSSPVLLPAPAPAPSSELIVDDGYDYSDQARNDEIMEAWFNSLR